MVHVEYTIFSSELNVYQPPHILQFHYSVSILLGFHNSEVIFKWAAITCHYPCKILFIVKTVTENVQRHIQGYGALSNYNIAKHNSFPIDLDLIQTLEIIEKLQVITPCPEWGDQNNNKLRIFWLTFYMYIFMFFHFLWGSNPKGDSCHFKGDSLQSFTESPNRWKGLCFPGNTDRLWFPELLIILATLIHICQLLYSVMLIIQQSENDKEHSPFLENRTFPSRLETPNKNTFEELFSPRQISVSSRVFGLTEMEFIFPTAALTALHW